MDFMLNADIKKSPKQISYRDKIMLTGSCFTEHIGSSLTGLKFSVLQNPNGILFDPISVAGSLQSYMQNRQYAKNDLFKMNELWQSWQHHSCFSKTAMQQCLHSINSSQAAAHAYLQKASWLIVTLGSAYSYRLTQEAAAFQPQATGTSVANCHRAPAQWFNKHLLGIDEIIIALEDCIQQLQTFNAGLNIIFTVSPVRHIRDGVVENNRSKARLIESVHQLVNKYDHLFYFPAYELVIDVLRDYRFYDVDLVHPNYMATQFVFEKFSEVFLADESKNLIEIKKIVTARKHKAFQPATAAHKKFLQAHFEKTKELIEKFPYLDFTSELKYFSEAGINSEAG